MIARGFKPVGWVAAVAGAALGCYMLSLNVASERADLAKVEHQILAAKQDIRSLQTELGTRGRLTQLEHWNSDVLALSAPASKQFLQNEFRLASYTEPQQSLDERIAKVRLASADGAAPQPSAKPAISADFAPDESRPEKSLVHQASLVVTDAVEAEARPTAPAKAAPPKPAIVRIVAAKPTPAKAAPVKTASARPATDKTASLIGSDLIKEIGAASRAEKKSGGAGTR